MIDGLRDILKQVDLENKLCRYPLSLRGRDSDTSVIRLSVDLKHPLSEQGMEWSDQQVHFGAICVVKHR